MAGKPPKLAGKPPKRAKPDIAEHFAKPDGRRDSPWKRRTLVKMDTGDAEDFAKPVTAERKRRATPQKQGDSRRVKGSPQPAQRSAVPPEQQVYRGWLLESCRLVRNARSSNGDVLLDPDAIALVDRVLDEGRTPTAAQCLLARLILATSHASWHLGCAALQKRAGLDARGADEAEGWSDALNALADMQLVQVLRYGVQSARGGTEPQPDGADSAMGRCGSQSNAVQSAAVMGGGVCVQDEAGAPCSKDRAEAMLAESASVPGAAAVGAAASPAAFDLRTFTVNVAMPLLLSDQLLAIAPPKAGLKSTDTKATRASKLAGYAQRLERDRREISASAQAGAAPARQPLFDLEDAVARALACKPGCGGAAGSGAGGVRFVRLRMEARPVEALLSAVRLADPLTSSAAPLRLLPAPGSSKGGCSCDAPRPACVMAIERVPKHDYDLSVVPDLEPGHVFGSRASADAFSLAVEIKCAVRAALVRADPLLQPGKKDRSRVPNSDEIASAARAYAVCQPQVALQRLRSLLAPNGGGAAPSGDSLLLSVLDGAGAAVDAARLIAAQAADLLKDACALPLPPRPWLVQFHAGAQLALAVWGAVPGLEEEASRETRELAVDWLRKLLHCTDRLANGSAGSADDATDASVGIGGSGAAERSGDASIFKSLRGQCYHRLLINLGHLKQPSHEIRQLCAQALADPHVRGEWREEVAKRAHRLASAGVVASAGDASTASAIDLPVELPPHSHTDRFVVSRLGLHEKPVDWPGVHSCYLPDELDPNGVAAALDQGSAGVDEGATVFISGSRTEDCEDTVHGGKAEAVEDGDCTLHHQAVDGLVKAGTDGERVQVALRCEGMDCKRDSAQDEALPSPTPGAVAIVPTRGAKLEGSPCPDTPRLMSLKGAPGSGGRHTSAGGVATGSGQRSGACRGLDGRWPRAACLRVEQKAAEFYSRPEAGGWFELGPPCKAWDEGSHLRTLCGLLLWEQIRAPVAAGGVWAHTSQRLPLDFGTPHFYSGRRAVLDDRLQQLRVATAPQLVDMISTAYTAHYGQMCGLVHWPACCPRTSQALAVCLGGCGVAALLGRFAREGFFGDLPDLTLVRAFKAVRITPACGAPGGVGGGGGEPAAGDGSPPDPTVSCTRVEERPTVDSSGITAADAAASAVSVCGAPGDPLATRGSLDKRAALAASVQPDAVRWTPVDVPTWLRGVSRSDAPPVRFNIGKTMRFRTSEAERRVQRETVAPAEATLEPEPTNSADPTALKVIVGGQHVGYVPRTHNRLVEPGPARLVETGEPGSANWVLEAPPCAVLHVGGASSGLEIGGQGTGSEGGDEALVFECALVEVKGPGDSFAGRLGQLLWLRDLRVAGVNARLCYIEEPPDTVNPWRASRSYVRVRQAAGAEAARNARSLGVSGSRAERDAPPCVSAGPGARRAVWTLPPRLTADDDDDFAAAA